MPLAASPLSLLTPPARERFLASLRFGRHGLSSLGLGDLKYDLTPTEAAEVLALFGVQQYAAIIDVRSTPRPASLDGGPGSLAPAYDRLVAAYEAHKDPAQRARAVGTSYAKELASRQQPARLQQLGNRDMQLLFRAAALAFNATSEPARLRDMQHDLAQLERHGVADRPHYAELYRALLTAHRSQEANALLAAHPVLQRAAPPTMHDAAITPGVPSLWIASTHKRELSREPFVLDAPGQVVVLAGTDCHYSRNAVRAIEADPVLGELFQQHARWLAPAEEIASFDAVDGWNQQHPTQPLAIINDNAEWRGLGAMATPTFYFYRHGKLIDTVVGWPDQGERPALLRALREIGLTH